MKINLFFILLTMFFSHYAYSCGIQKTVIPSFNSKIKAKNIVSVAVGDNAKSITQLGSIDSDSQPQNKVIKLNVDNILHYQTGDNVISCIQLPDENNHCQ